MKKFSFITCLMVTCAFMLCSCLEKVEPIGKPFDEKDIPSKYDLTEKQRVSAVRYRQAEMSDIPYALMGAAESNIITRECETPESADFSENHLCYYTETGNFDPAKADENFEGFVTKENQGEAYSCTAGRLGLSAFIANMINGVGIEMESNAPMSSDGTGQSIREMKVLEDTGAVRKYDGKYILTEYNCIAEGKMTERDIKNIQKEIMLNGAVYAQYRMDEKYIKAVGNEKVFYNFDQNENYSDGAEQLCGGALDIIGWDDGYARENFDINGNVPENNGAWLCRTYNEKYAGENGCVWVSYYENSLMIASSLALRKYSYANDVLRYDETGYHDSIRSDSGNTVIANIFTGTKGGLNAVGVTTLKNNQKVRIRVFKDPQKNKPDSGKLVMDSEETIPYKGYHAVGIYANLPLNKNDHFSVIVSYMDGGEAPVEGETQENVIISSGIGESFVYDGKKWLDAHDPETAKLFGKNAINNCCIKALVSRS